MKNIGRKRFLGGFIFLALFAAAAAIVMLLWNWIIPSVIGWGVLTYWQSAGLLLLCKLLFGGFGGKNWHKPHPHFHRKEMIKMRENVRGMSADERREYIRNHMFGGHPGGPSESANGDR